MDRRSIRVKTQEIMLEAIKKGGINMITAPDLERAMGITVAFTGRNGGTSKPPFEQLNLAYDVGDERKAVTSNRLLLGKELSISPDDWVVGRQVHGSCVKRVGELERGRGGVDTWSAIPRSDGVVTESQGIALCILTADCLPLVLVCGPSRVVGVAHVGWRGALYRVTESAIVKLLEYAGCRKEEITAFLGPCIGPCCLKVGQEVADEFRRFIGDEAVIRGDDGSMRLDLASLCRRQLVEAGIESKNIFSAEVCTRCDEGYFSYRGSGGNTGRQAGIVALR